MKNQYLAWPVLAATAALALSGCGTTEAPKQESAKETSITVTDSRGKKVTLDGPAKRVVGTEWNVVETLVTLGVQPVGVADVKGYTAYDTSAPLTGDVKDIGTRGEPSFATVAGLNPTS
ncbi:iron-siderophore ABC transporter substrate-binding protein, partial [Streptomyces cavourensis]